MMTHIFGQSNQTRIIAAKGAPEALMNVSDLTATEKAAIINALKVMAAQGYRVLGVGQSHFEGSEYPAAQQELKFVFKGLVAFYDPPKKGIQHVLKTFYEAGISVKIITGDNELTTAAISQEIGLIGHEKSLSGDALMAMDEAHLKDIVQETNVFTRMFPEAKLRIINALKSQNQIVAMTGDGVNDGPALKAAHIGVAMGKKGSEIAKQSASLILVDDDLGKMADAVAIGRKIYTNLKKAIQYIISIHIPIVLTVFLPLALGWVYPNIFTPVHVIFLELIMGPTCSIIYENEPIERNTMSQKPRQLTSTFFNWEELTLSIIQGLVITAGTLTAYQLAVFQGNGEAATRTIVFCVLIAANVFLTLTNRSLYYSILKTLRSKNNLVPLIIAITLLITGLLIYVPALANFFQFVPLSPAQLLQALGIGFISVIWFEGYKWIKRWK